MEKTRRIIVMMSIVMLSMLAMNSCNKLIIKGSFAEVQRVNKFNIEMDWSKIHINGLTPYEWIRFRNAEQPIFDAEEEYQTELKPRWIDMVDACNDELNEKQVYLFPNDSRQYYKLIVTPLQIDRNGNIKALCTIKDYNSRVLVIFALTGEGGRVGSMSNLWGDGFKSAGKNLAKILEKNLHIY